ncbi:hypothetical protein M407DRAFT_30233 [Tulasnella calospora MUT 4182]|uniref:Uncharacterized protein n=1 Tax=Tulasnella calospora MUT 4182 TaxID=1051891 RepID=A0A0C3LF85_9AGAM|nr:hypothetical protein M407DRAFT_30233 [Tulasnella calospora MUT 4182]
MTSTTATMKEEAEAPQGYKYSWSADAKPELSADEFIAKFKPSVITDDGSKPWIWICGPGYTTPYKEEDASAAILEGVMKLTEAAEQVEAIQHDASIPVRGNKKTGTKSKKEVRDEVQAEARGALRTTAQKHHFTNGKWLSYGNTDNIDGLWAKIARSVASGPLSTSPARLAKVSTAKRGEGADSHVLCLYLPDIFDETAARDVLKILIREHGILPSGAKPDLYTHIGLDSKHKSGIRSTALRDAHDVAKAASSSASRGKAPEPKAENDEDGGDIPKNKAATNDEGPSPPKLKVKAKPRKDDEDDEGPSNPFASDEDEEPSASQKAEAARKAALFKATSNSNAKQTVAISKPKVPKSKIEIAKETATLAKKQSEITKGKERAKTGVKPTARRTEAKADTESEEEAVNPHPPPISSKARGKKRAADVEEDDDDEEEEEDEMVKPKAKARRKK